MSNHFCGAILISGFSILSALPKFTSWLCLAISLCLSTSCNTPEKPKRHFSGAELTDEEETAVETRNNTIPALSDANANQGFSGKATGNGSRTVDPVNTFVVTGNIRVVHKGDLDTSILQLEESIYSFDRKLLSKSGKQEVRNWHILAESLDLETFAARSQNSNKRIFLGAQVGMGPRFRIYERIETKLSTGVAYMNEYEKLTKGKFADSGGQERTNRLSSYVDYARQINRNSYGLRYAYVPDIENHVDRRVAVTLSLLFPTGKSAAIEITTTVQHDSMPPESVSNITSQAKTNFTVGF
jgi:hypothetical protein